MTITSGLLEKIIISGSDQNRATMIIVMLNIKANGSATFSPWLMPCSLLFSMFYPTNTERATNRGMAGRGASESIRLAAVKAAIMFVPNVFTMPVRAIIPRATKVCCIPWEGQPEGFERIFPNQI